MKVRNVPNLTHQHYSISQYFIQYFFLLFCFGFSYKINWIKSLRPNVPLPYWKLQEGLFYKNTSMRGRHSNLTWLGEQIVVLVPGQAALGRVTLDVWLCCAFPDPQPWDSPCKPISWCRTPALPMAAVTDSVNTYSATPPDTISWALPEHIKGLE